MLLPQYRVTFSCSLNSTFSICLLHHQVRMHTTQKGRNERKSLYILHMYTTSRTCLCNGEFKGRRVKIVRKRKKTYKGFLETPLLTPHSLKSFFCVVVLGFLGEKGFDFISGTMMKRIVLGLIWVFDAFYCKMIVLLWAWKEEKGGLFCRKECLWKSSLCAVLHNTCLMFI